jgi:hypothetical protein
MDVGRLHGLLRRFIQATRVPDFLAQAAIKLLPGFQVGLLELACGLSGRPLLRT